MMSYRNENHELQETVLIRVCMVIINRTPEFISGDNLMCPDRYSPGTYEEQPDLTVPLRSVWAMLS